MASVTTLKFPDGRTESKKVLSFFEKNNESIMVFETDKLENGNKVVGLSYLVDGFYQNIVDEAKWAEIKSNLVAILKDQIGNEDYRVVPSEISVTADPYRQLALRDANLDKIIASYEAFLSTQPQGGDNIGEMSQDIANMNMDSSIEAPVVPENVNTIEPQQTNDLENSVQPEPIMNNDITSGPEMNTISEIDNNTDANINDVVPDIPILGNINSDVVNMSTEETIAQEPVANDISSAIPSDVPVNQELSATEEPNILDVAPVEEVIPMDNQPVIQDIVPPTDAPGIDAFANVAPVIEDSVSNQEPSVLDSTINNQVSIEDNNEGEASTSLDIFNNGPVISEAPITEGVVAISEPEAPVIDIAPANENNSAVQSAYLDNVEKIKEEINQITNGYIENIKKLSDAYMKDIDEKKVQIKGILEEAKGINALSRETFDRAQAISNNVDNQA